MLAASSSKQCITSLILRRQTSFVRIPRFLAAAHCSSNNNNYHAHTLQMTTTPMLSRCYSGTRTVWKKDDKKTTTTNGISDETVPRYQTINNSNLSDAEIERIIAEEEANMMAEEQNKYVADWKPGMRKKPLTVSYTLDEFEYELEPDDINKQQARFRLPRWTLLDRRCGALAIKVGMMPVYDTVWGVRFPCTVLYMDNNIVMGHKTVEKHGYAAAQIAAGQRKRKNVTNAVLGQYPSVLLGDDESSEKHPPYLVREFRVSDEAYLPPLLTRLHARHFVPGQNVDVSGISKGKGFQGPMKRHNFAGLRASHGVSVSHRAHGSVGSCQDPGKVFKGKKMAGHMGAERVTTQNLRVLKVDAGRNLLYVVGAVPGPNGNFVEIRDAVKKPLWRTKSVLDALERPPLPTFEYDPAIDGCGEAGHEIFMPMPDYDPLAPDREEDAA